MLTAVTSNKMGYPDPTKTPEKMAYPDSKKAQENEYSFMLNAVSCMNQAEMDICISVGDEQEDWILVEPLKANSELSGSEKDGIIALLNEGYGVDKILQFSGVSQGTIKADAIESFVSNLLRPPKPPPQRRKRLSVKTNGESLPVYHYKSREQFGAKYTTFLVLGETGTGKTTLLDAFANCLEDMQFTDNWRWKMVDEDSMKDKHTSKSQTSDITYYYITDKRQTENPCNIKIIDTPGFADTEGITADEKTIKKFEELFKTEISELDYILLVVKAGETRWTHQARYVYDRVQELFHKAAADRFILMCTFADGGPPQVISTLKPHVAFEKFFTFNNSALYTPSEQATNTTKFFWRMAMSSVDQFLSYVVQQDRKPLSLVDSVQVLDTRDYLYTTIQNAQRRIQQGFSFLESTQALMQQIKKHEDQINENGSFTYDEWEDRYERKPLGKTVQLCAKCNVTCCQKCEWPKHATESQCTYFNYGRCPVCPGKCPKSSHVRSDELVTKTQVKVTKEWSFKKQALKEGEEGLSSAQRMLKQKEDEMDQGVRDILADMQNVKDALTKLDAIALKPRVFTDESYFEQMIQYEEDTRNPGYEGRIVGLKLMMERARDMKKLSQAKDMRDLFPQYKKIMAEARKRCQQISTDTAQKCQQCAAM